MALKFKPNGDRIVIKPNLVEEKTSSGLLYIPDTAKEKPNKGVVVAVGLGRYAEDTGYLIPLNCKVGDTVLYSKYGGVEVSIENENYLIMRDTDILIIL